VVVVHVAEVIVRVMPPGLDVNVYVVIVAPPLDPAGVVCKGPVHATVTDVALATVAVPIVGAPGTVAGVTEVDALDKPDVPAVFVAVVLKKYVSPFVKPVTTHEPDAPVTVQPVEYSPPEVVDLVIV
jgi:hypothetical protein